MDALSFLKEILASTSPDALAYSETLLQSKRLVATILGHLQLEKLECFIENIENGEVLLTALKEKQVQLSEGLGVLLVDEIERVFFNPSYTFTDLKELYEDDKDQFQERILYYLRGLYDPAYN